MNDAKGQLSELIEKCVHEGTCSLDALEAIGELRDRAARLEERAKADAQAIDGLTKNREYAFKGTDNPMETLRDLALPTHFSTAELWRIGSTAERVEFVIFCVIAFSAIVGTVLWGYGRLLF